jgi:predicted regulator of Ras-like GTPase activity (Roadblock/LC7/MglB family)
MSIDDMMADVRRAHSAVASAQAEVAKREMGLEDARQMLVEAMEHHARLAAEATAAFEEGMLLR